MTDRVTLERKSFLLPVDHGLFNNCHASTIVTLPGERRLVAFFGGAREAAGDVAIWLVAGQGEAWSAPRRLMAEEGLAHWNPVLHVEGEVVWLFYKVGPDVHSWVTRWAMSRDGGETWSAPRPLVAGDSAPRGPVRNKLLVMSDGAWLAPASIEGRDHWDCFVDISADRGASWQRAEIPFDHRPPAAGGDGAVWSGLAAQALWETDPVKVFHWDGIIQPTAWESAPGRIHMLMRSTRGELYRSDSEDFGRSWCAAYPGGIVNNNSGVDLAALPGGTLALAYNPVQGNWGARSPLSLALSRDNGRSFGRVLDLETGEGEFSYPAIVAAQGKLHLTYTFNRKSIVYCRLRPGGDAQDSAPPVR